MINMGLGELGGPQIIHKRKFRWSFEVTKGPCGLSVPRSFVKLASRPNISFEETEINYLNGKTWIPGKATWETITVTYYDIASDDNIGLWSWIASVYDYTDQVGLRMGTARQDYAASAELIMYDGCGSPLEIWSMGDAWPQAVNFGELDFANSEEATVEITLRYAQVNYTNMCGAQPQPCCVTSCG